MTELVFNERDHTYFLGARRLDSVTQILKACGFIGDWGSPEDLERGNVVDKCCELLAQGKLDWSQVDPRVLGYVLSYQRCLEHTGCIARAVKQRLYDEQLGFAGEFDVDFESGLLIDLKAPRSGSGKAKWHKLQTAAYRHLNGDKGQRGTVYLQPDGSMPKLIEHKDHREDWAGFLSCLNFVRTKEKYG
jgi:hypothetical protein